MALPQRNVCAVRRISDGYFWQSNAEHGTGWTQRVRQAWTEREARLTTRGIVESGWAKEDELEVVELVPANPV